MRTSLLLWVAALAAAAAGARVPVQCAESCGKCCGAGYSLQEAGGAYTCTRAGGGASCVLCGPGASCAFDAGNAGVPYARLLSPAGVSAPQNNSVALGTFSGMPGWPQLPGSVLLEFRGPLLGVTATLPPFRVDGGSKAVFTCEGGGAVAAGPGGCDLFVFAYRCPPCKSLNSDVGAVLLAADAPAWRPSSCGPSFRLDSSSGAEHSLIMYEAELPYGAEYTLTFPGPIELTFWGMVEKTATCAGRSEAECQLVESCAFDADQDACVPSTCGAKKSAFVGPPAPKCQVCVEDERRAFVKVCRDGQFHGCGYCWAFQDMADMCGMFACPFGGFPGCGMCFATRDAAAGCRCSPGLVEACHTCFERAEDADDCTGPFDTLTIDAL
ncbi:hypothetical protein DIPPA_14121 [Diplonema papillatum]|nr:hypothetical protein DIPPA_14121 [Diplonema papillatum]